MPIQSSGTASVLRFCSLRSLSRASCRGLVVVLWVGGSAGLLASAQSRQDNGRVTGPVIDAQLRAAMAEVDEGRTMLDVVTLADARGKLASCLAANTSEAGCAYELARSEMYLKQAEDAAHHSKAARQWLDLAVTDGERAAQLAPNAADAHAQLAAIDSQEISGMTSAMRYGPRVNAELARALQLDPNNTLAYSVMGRRCLYAPAMFGGDTDKAIQDFQRAVRSDPRSDENYVWLAMAYWKKGNKAQAHQAMDEALRLNSRSRFAQQTQAGW